MSATRHPDQDRLTGEFDAGLGLPRPVPEFDARGYLKVPGTTAKLSRAINQVPSIFELGTRIKTILKDTKK